MIATLKFNLSDLDEKYNFELMMKAADMKAVLNEFKEYIRSCYKHGMREGISVPEAMEEIFGMFNDYLIDHGVIN
jgi:hypothetical protein